MDLFKFWKKKKILNNNYKYLILYKYLNKLLY